MWAKGLLCLEAAVELLIGNRSWLLREDFLEIAVEFGWEVFSCRPMAAVDFVAVAGALEAGVAAMLGRRGPGAADRGEHRRGGARRYAGGCDRPG